MKHLDAPVWMVVIATFLLAGSLSCFGMAATAQADVSAHLAAAL